jgi:F0F1-type ATP synthase epsilon subunit
MALPTKLALEIVTPDRSLIREEVDEVVVPGTEGELGILPGHTPLLSTLKVGELWYPARTGEALSGDRVWLRRGTARFA